MSLRDVFRLSPASAAGPALTAVADMLGLDWNTKLNTLNEKIDAAIAEQNALALERQALALAATEDATAEKELAAVERKHAAVGLTLERLQLATVEVERHNAAKAQTEYERLRQANVKATTKEAKELHAAVAEAQAATDLLEKALAKVTAKKHALIKSTGQHLILAEIETKVVNSIKDQLSAVCGSFSRSEYIPYDKRGDASQYVFPVEYFADAAARYFDKQ